jgi:hypothetical protein
LVASGRESVGEVDAAARRGLGRDELARGARRSSEQSRAGSRDDRDDQVELVEQVGVDEAGDKSRATTTERVARLLLRFTNLLTRTIRAVGRSCR